MWSTRERGVARYLEQVEIKYLIIICQIYFLPAMDGVSFLKVRSSFWETSGENLSNNKEMKEGKNNMSFVKWSFTQSDIVN